MALKRKRRPPPVSPSTLTPMSGEWYAEHGTWTTPLDDRWVQVEEPTAVLTETITEGRAHLIDRALPIYHPSGSVGTSIMDVETGTFVVVPVPERATPNGDGRAVFVDHRGRRVWMVDDARFGSPPWEAATITEVGFDEDGVDLPAAGVVLSREIATGRVRHAVALHGDCGLTRGVRVRLDPAIEVGRLRVPHATRTIARALQEFGGIVMGGDDSGFSVICERAPGDVSDDVGTVYREAGWGRDPAVLALPWGRMEALRRTKKPRHSG